MRRPPAGSLLAMFGGNGHRIVNTYVVLSPGASGWKETKCTVSSRYGVGSTSLNGHIFFAGGRTEFIGISGLVDSFHPYRIIRTRTNRHLRGGPCASHPGAPLLLLAIPEIP
ncbi:MAG: hypothetical protein V2G42_08825 [bacterium JZ-2024 1]